MKRLCRLAPAIVLALLVGGTGDAAAQTPAASTGQELDVPRAPVVIDGDTVFLVRGLSVLPAEQRASAIAERIEAVAVDRTIAPASLTLEERDGTTRILAAGRPVTVVLDEDAAREGVDRRVLAEAYRVRIGEAITGYREARDPAALRKSGLLAIAATLVLAAALFAGARVFRWLSGRIEHRYRARVEGVSAHTYQLIKAEQLWGMAVRLLRTIWMLALLAVVFLYLQYTLALFPWTRGTGRHLFDLVLTPLRRVGLGFVGSIPELVFLFVLFLLTRGVLRLIRLFFDSVGSGAVTLRNFHPDWAAPTYRLVRLLVIALALVVAYPYVPGSQSEAFKGISVFLGLMFSLGSSSLIGNLIAGYSMTYRRAFQPGDRVKIGEYIGEVTEVRLMATRIRTPKNEEVIVPNSKIVSEEVVNYSSLAQSRGLLLHTQVGINYAVPWRQVEAMLIEAAERTPGLRKDPPPFVLQRGLGDFAVTYELNVACETPSRMPYLYAELHRQILDVFNEYGVQIMTPAYEGDPAEPKIVPKDQWHAAPAAVAPTTAHAAMATSTPSTESTR